MYIPQSMVSEKYCFGISSKMQVVVIVSKYNYTV